MRVAHCERLEDQPTWPRLVADIGGTNARFAWLSGPGEALEHVMVLPGAEFDGPLQAIESYLAQTGLPRPACAALGTANPVHADEVQMTNLHWRFSVETLRQQLDLRTLLVLNDFTALVLAIPGLDPQCVHPIGPVLQGKSAVIGLLGPGTGLGVSGWIPASGSAQGGAIMGEGGHVTLAATHDLEYDVIRQLRQRYGHVSAERVLCGTGLVDLFHALATISGQPGSEVTTAAQVLSLGLGDASPLARQALELFCGWLGSVAGDLALTLGATGGIYIGGGIAPRLREFLSQSDFRQRFEAKGRFQNYLQAIPTWLIDAPVSPALDGAARALDMQIEVTA
jgi:glucokinase